VTRREWLFLSIGIVGVLVGLFGLWRWLSDYDGRKAIDLATFVDPPDTYLPGARMATSSLCSDTVPCIQAVDSDTMTLRRFESAEQASATAAMLGGDVRLAGWILVEFKPGALSDEKKSEFLSSLYCLHVGPDPC
jgi:hypothetical protein